MQEAAALKEFVFFPVDIDFKNRFETKDKLTVAGQKLYPQLGNSFKVSMFVFKH